MPTVRNLQKASQSRVWTIEDRAAPSHVPVYELLSRATGITWGQGGITPVRVPDPEQYGKFITVDKIRGQPDLPGTSIEVRMTRSVSHFLKLIKKGCPIDVQIHVGLCKDPSDFDLGWEKIHVFENADFSNYSTSELGAFDFDQENPTTETVDFMADDYYEIAPISLGEEAGSYIVQEVLGVVICDARTCGICGLPSDGCQRVFAIQTPAGASPGLPAEVVYTRDSGVTWLESVITSLPANGTPSGVGCVGPYLVVVSNTDDSIHYASIVDLFDETEVWQEVTTGIVAAGSPNKLFSTGRTKTWIVGDAGYIYFSDDISAGVEAQSAGDIVVTNLTAIHGIDDEYLLVGGATNTILTTTNGGETWVLITGPSAQAAADVTAVYMASELEWIVGYSDGALYYTYDGGDTWFAKGLPGGLVEINDIKFATRTVGYLAGNTGAVGGGRMLRTVNGGHTWYLLPDGAGDVPVAREFNSIAACGDDVNVVWAGGLKVTAGDGILIKGA